MDADMSGVVYFRTPISGTTGLGAGAVCAGPAPVMSEPDKVLLENLAEIEEIIASMGRRKSMDAATIEEFAAHVKLRLVSDDYAIIRAYQGRSSFATYMAAVVAHLLLDYRNHEWGKWHASAEAERLGAAAVELERYLHRDGRSLDEAFAELARKNSGICRAEVDALALRLPKRVRRRTVALDEALTVGTIDDHGTVERARAGKTISAVVTANIAKLPDEDQLLLRLRFDSDMSVAQISRSLHLDQQVLYRRLRKLFGELRKALGRAGIAAGDVADLIGKDTVQLDFRLKNADPGPSEEEESGAAGRPKETP